METETTPQLIRWEPPAHKPNERITDGPWGRYLVRRNAPGERRFIALLNGTPTTFYGTTPIDCMVVVERAIMVNFPGFKPLLGKGSHA